MHDIEAVHVEQAGKRAVRCGRALAAEVDDGNTP
jgi:hypothetical protein